MIIKKVWSWFLVFGSCCCSSSLIFCWSVGSRIMIAHRIHCRAIGQLISGLSLSSLWSFSLSILLIGRIMWRFLGWAFASLCWTCSRYSALLRVALVTLWHFHSRIQSSILFPWVLNFLMKSGYCLSWDVLISFMKCSEHVLSLLPNVQAWSSVPHTLWPNRCRKLTFCNGCLLFCLWSAGGRTLHGSTMIRTPNVTFISIVLGTSLSHLRFFSLLCQSSSKDFHISATY